GVGIFDGFQEAVGHLGGTLVEVGVDAGDDQIHLFEDGIGQIECAVGQNIYFDSGEDSDSVDVFIRGADAFDVLYRALVVEPVGERQIFGMFSDGHVFVTVGGGGPGLLL